MAENNSYPPPETPLSFREVLRKTLDDPGYASFIHGEVLRAQEAETEEERLEAMDNIDAHFMLSSEELTWLDLPAGFGSGPCAGPCTDTKPTIGLLDFATATPSWSSEEEV
jgi:hypothetical protein